MNNSETIKELKKCTLVIDCSQPVGIIANTASVLSITLGRQLNNLVGADVYDKDGERHLGITQMPIPILGASPDKIKEIRLKLLSLARKDVIIIDFCDIAQKSKTYQDYEAMMRLTGGNDVRYIDIAIYGDKKTINKVTGNLSLIK